MAPVAAERSMQSKAPAPVAGGVALPAMVSAPPPQKQHFDEYQPTPTIQSNPAPPVQSAPPVTSGALVQADEKPRQVIFIKAKNVGIRLAGGNDVGIFVASVQGCTFGDLCYNFNNTENSNGTYTVKR